MAKPDGGGRPLGLTTAAVGVGLEALAVLTAVGALGLALLRREVDSLGLAAGGVLVGLGATLVLARFARALLLVQAWVRAPVLVTQLLLLPIGWSVRGSTGTGAAVVGVLLLVLAAGVLVAVLSPGAGRAFGPRRPPS